MKATVEVLPSGRFDIVGLRKPAINPLAIENGKETFEIIILRSFLGKTYKTMKAAIKALESKGFEYIPEDTINTVIGWD